MILLSVSAEKTPAAAAEAFVGSSGATVLSAESTQVNGLAARRVLCDVTSEQSVLRVLSCFIQVDGVVYALLGYSAQGLFETHRPAIERTIGQFRRLTDKARINVSPDRLALRRTTRQGTLRQALQGFGVATAKLDTHAIMNGMNLDDAVASGTLLKVVVAGAR